MAISVRKLPVVSGDDTDSIHAPISRPAGLPSVRPFRRTLDEAITTKRFEVTGELAEVVKTIKSNFGANVITRANEERAQYGRVMSGILTLDLCLGGGLMLSRASMLYGNRSAGKSTVALKFIAAIQRHYSDQVVVYLDVEGTFDPAWAQRLGVDLDRLLVLEPETGEHAVDLADAVLRTKETCMLITDSIAFLTPMKEIEVSAEDSLPGLQARLMGKYIRKTNNALLQERHRGHFPHILHLNQFRMSIGLTFGDPRVLPGGKALEFATSQQIEISNKEHTADSLNKAAKDAAKARGEKVEKVDKAEGGGALVVYNEHTFKITKDKTGGRMKEGKFKLIRDESQGLPVGYIDQSKTIVSFGLACGILSGAPNAFSHDTFGKWKGSQEFVKFLVENQHKELEICSQIVASYKKRWGVSG